MGRPPLDLTGKTFGMLTVVSRATPPKGKIGTWWACRCTCGGLSTNKGGDIASGRVNSCGCLLTAWRKKKGAMSAKHHFSRKRNKTYTAWCAMRSRCFNPKIKSWKHYGGRGITVCDRWDDFKNFLEDMGEVPSPELSLDRYPDNNGDYEPGNCRWATAKQQANNKRNNRKKLNV